MKKLSLLLIVGLLFCIPQTIDAQFNVSGAVNKARRESAKSKEKKTAAKQEKTEQEEKDKDYPLLSRFEGSKKVFERTAKWEEYKLPLIENNDNLQWENYTLLEGKIIRYQYSVSPDNNPAYVLKMYKMKLENAGFTILYAKANKEMEISTGDFNKKYNTIFGNAKFGYAYGTTGKDQSYIVGKMAHDGKTIFVAIYVSAFDNTTLITQDIIEAESIKEHKVIITLFKGSSVAYDDKMGFDKFFVTTSVSPDGVLTTKEIEGNITHRFCYVPTGHSVTEIITSYEEAIKNNGGKILVSSSGKEFYKEFSKKRPEHGLTNYEWIQFGLYNYYYLSGFISGDKFDYYIIVLPAQVDKKLVYSIVIIETKPMEKGLVTASNIDQDMLAKGHVALYDIYFETGKSTLLPKSAESLTNVAAYLNKNPDKKFYIVGHTDNTGDFAANKTLSEERAKSVMNELTTKYNVNTEQLTAFGVSSLSPVSTNASAEGKAKNRRVEIVEQ